MGERVVERVVEMVGDKDGVVEGQGVEVPPPARGVVVATALPMSMKRNEAYRWSLARVVHVSRESGKGAAPSSAVTAENKELVILNTHPLRHARSVSTNQDPEPKRGSGSVEEEK